MFILRTFTRWFARPCSLQVTNIETDLRDGLILIHLIERLTGNQIKTKYHAQPSHRIQKLDNMEVVISSMKTEGIHLVSASE